MKKNILVIGGGGREHAVCSALKKSESVGKIYALPGNAGIAEIAECNDIKSTDINAILRFVKSHPDIYMTVVTPDDPLSMGLVDLLNQNGFRAFGPVAAAAKIESSKVFSKALMKKYGIPTAEYAAFDDFKAAGDYIKTARFPLVIKADGLALGKGVIICQTLAEATDALSGIMLDKKFGDAGASVVVEEFLVGKEVSVLAFTDGETIRLMPPSRDHKRALDGDKGPNTGGMGVFSPVDDFKPFSEAAEKEIYMPTINALKAEGITFKGILYFGLILTKSGPKVLEYNARFGDPETQAVLPGLLTDLLEIFDSIIDGRLDKIDIKWDNKYHVCVVAASGGYPNQYEKGKQIVIGEMPNGATVFHAGTARQCEKLITNGGRVLCVSADGDTLQKARDAAYDALKNISFEGMFFRSDICK